MPSFSAEIARYSALQPVLQGDVDIPVPFLRSGPHPADGGFHVHIRKKARSGLGDKPGNFIDPDVLRVSPGLQIGQAGVEIPVADNNRPLLQLPGDHPVGVLHSVRGAQQRERAVIKIPMLRRVHVIPEDFRFPDEIGRLSGQKHR